jgi:hypothetical protein
MLLKKGEKLKKKKTLILVHAWSTTGDSKIIYIIRGKARKSRKMGRQMKCIKVKGIQRVGQLMVSNMKWAWIA